MRRLGQWPGWAALLLGVAGVLAIPSARAASPTEVNQQIEPRIVAVGTYMETRRPPTQFRATGLIAGNGRYVVTNAHVLPERLDEQNRDASGIFSAQGDSPRLDATAYPGNSGSPIHDRNTGKVIAVLGSVYIKSTKENLLSDPRGISYAIPIRYVRTLPARLPQ